MSDFIWLGRLGVYGTFFSNYIYLTSYILPGWQLNARHTYSIHLFHRPFIYNCKGYYCCVYRSDLTSFAQVEGRMH